MLQAGASILAALRSARDAQVKEFNAAISVLEKLIDAISSVEVQLADPLEKRAGKRIIEELHSFLIRSSTQWTRGSLPPPTVLSTPPAIPEVSPLEASTSSPPPTTPVRSADAADPAPISTRRWSDIAATSAQSPRGTDGDPRRTIRPATTPTNSSEDRKESRRAFLRIDRDKAENPFWRQATPAEVTALLTNHVGFPRDFIQRVYPVRSGWCIETTKQHLRALLIQKASEKGLVAEPEEVTFAYIVRNVPQTIRDYTGQSIETAPLLQQEAAAVTHQKDAKVIKSKSGAWIVILRRQCPNFRLFDSDPAILTTRNPRIYSCERCFGFHHQDKCRYAAVCGKCGGLANNHLKCRPVPQCPNCLAPALPGHRDCPAAPKVSQGRVIKPTREQRFAFRKAGHAAYKAKVAEYKNAAALASTPVTPVQNSPSNSRGDLSPVPPDSLAGSNTDTGSSGNLAGSNTSVGDNPSIPSPSDWMLACRPSPKKVSDGRITKRKFNRPSLGNTISRFRALEKGTASSGPSPTILHTFPPRDRPESPDPINTI